MYKELDIDYTDQSLFEEDDLLKSQEEKEFYTPEEAYELIMSDIKSILLQLRYRENITSS